MKSNTEDNNEIDKVITDIFLVGHDCGAHINRKVIIVDTDILSCETKKARSLEYDSLVERLKQYIQSNYILKSDVVNILDRLEQSIMSMDKLSNKLKGDK